MASRTQYYAATSIDGFLADDEHGIEWLLQFDFAEFQERYDAFYAGIGAILMGARSYEFILTQGDDAWAYGDTPCWVATHGEHAVPPGADVRFVEGDVRQMHAAAIASAGGRHVWLLGGGDLAAQLSTHGLIDDLVVTVVPVLLGSGKRLHPGVAITTPLYLVSTHRFASGAVELAYDLTGAAKA
jgi:dihydrofolate reductase